MEGYNMESHDVGRGDSFKFPLLLLTLRNKKVRDRISNLEYIHPMSNSLNHLYAHRRLAS